MAETATATKTSSDKAPAAPQAAAPPKVAAGGPTMQGMSPQEMQQRYGNHGAAALVEEAGAVEGQMQAEEAALSEAVAAGFDSVVDPPPIIVDPATAVEPATTAVTARATTSKKHDPAEVPVEAAQESAIVPAVGADQVAANETVAQIEEGSGNAKDVDTKSFKEELTEALEEVLPQAETEDEAKDFVDNGADDATKAFNKKVGGKSDENADLSEDASDPLVDAADPEAEVESEGGADEGPELVEEALGEPAGSVSEDSVVPSAYPDSQTDYSAYESQTDALMAENAMTDEQLAKGNEPEFNATLEAQGEAKEYTEAAPTSYRETEANVLGGGRTQATDSLTGGIGSFNSTREGQIGDVVTEQGETKSEDETKRKEIRDDIVDIKDDTTSDVNDILESMKETAEKTFSEELDKAIAAFDKVFEDTKRGFWSTSGNFISGLVSGKWEWDNNFDQAIEDANKAYKDVVDAAIDTIAKQVEDDLEEAAERVVEGRDAVDDYVDELAEDVKQFGEDARAEVQSDFDELTTTIDTARSSLIESLVAQYQESQNELAAREKELRDANKSWWQKAWDATVGAAQKILEFKNLLTEVLAGAMDVVMAIIEDPIGFLKNLIAGIMGGLMSFKDNIVEHLKGGLMGWLFGTLQDAGIELPTSFDIKGILQLVFSVLGATYDFIRGKMVDRLGEETVARLEQAAEIFMVLVTEGVGGIWQMLLEKIGDVKEMVLGAIQGFVIEKIIIAGITWLVSMLNPASAFFKACKAIYDIVMFFIERGQQIMELVNTIIGTISAIVEGKVDAMSTAVEEVLARILPVAISFLASLLGLGGISDKIREIIDKLRKPVDKAVNWIVEKAVELAKKLRGLFGGDKESKEEPDEDGTDEGGLSTLVIDFEMDGEGHQLTASESESGDVSVTMASKRARILMSLVKKASDGTRDPELEGELEEIKEHLGIFIRNAEGRIRESHRPSDPATRVDPISDERKKLDVVGGILSKIGKKYEVKDLEMIAKGSEGRPPLSPETKEEIQAQHDRREADDTGYVDPKTGARTEFPPDQKYRDEDGNPVPVTVVIDPNTGRPMRDYTKEELQERKTNPDVSPTGRIVVLEDPTTFHYGHREGNEYRRIKAARPDGMTDEQFAQFNDQASLFQVEPPNLNVSHQDEEKGPKKGDESEDDSVEDLNDQMIDFMKENK